MFLCPSVPRFFQVPKKLLERLQAQLEGGEEEEEHEGLDEREEALLAGQGEEGLQREGGSRGRAAGQGEMADQWGEFDDLVESWLVSRGGYSIKAL